MAQAYTPGLTVARRAVVRKMRKLPLPGETLVKVGDAVEADAVVARTNLPGDAHPLNLSRALSVPESDVEEHLLVKTGEPFQKGALLAETKGFFGLFKSRCFAPVEGSLETVSTVTGQAILREPPKPLEARAYVKGVVVETLEDEGAVVEMEGAFVQGILGVGGETHGELVLAVERGGELTAEKVLPSHEGQVLIVGGSVRAEALRKAAEVGAAGIAAGCIDAADLRDCLGYELGVAVTGAEEIGLTAIVTEGFGRIDMAEKTFELLKSLEGRQASMNGATQIRAGVTRPEILVPMEGEGEAYSASALTLETGAAVRVIREPRFGETGEIADLPVELQEIETGARVRVAVVRLQNGDEIALPRANIELIGG